MRKVVLVLLCLLSLAAVWLLWPGRERSAAPLNSAAPRASAIASAAGAAVPVAPLKISTLNLTNPVAFRLTNTTRTLRQLASQPHAILLQNALIDTDARLTFAIPAHLKSAAPGAYVVQARGVLDTSFRALLTGAGAQVISYIPNNAYLVKATAAEAGALAGNPRVQAVLPFEPYYKVQPSLLGLAVTQSPLPPGTALNLGLFAADATAEAQVTQAGAVIIGRDQSAFGPVLRVLAPDNWTVLAQLPGVQAVEPAHQRVSANDLSRVTLGISTDTTNAFNYLNLYGSNVLVAVNDTGIDATHPDLTGRVFGPDTNNDTAGHGTHVAGIIASSGVNSKAPPGPTDVGSVAEGSVPHADFRGKAPLATLFAMDFNLSDYVLQTNAYLRGALISNNSWDNGDAEYDLSASSYDAATRDALPFSPGSQPVLFVFSAGNAGNGNDDGGLGNSDSILSPGTAKNVVTVGAIEQLRNITNIVTVLNSDGTTNYHGAYWQKWTDSSAQTAWYSSRGNVGIGTEGAYGRFKPDVVAPGTFVVSTRSAQWDTNSYYSDTNNIGQTYQYQIVATNSLWTHNVSVPPNAVAVAVYVSANKYSPNPMPDMPIYIKQGGLPSATNYDIPGVNRISIPPASGGAIAGIQSLAGNGFYFAVANTNGSSVNLDISVAITVTNNYGDRMQVLEGMNDSLGGLYRYETGTSMAAAGVSGMLALIEDYFTNTLAQTPSPALLKAMLINGARPVGGNVPAVTNGINLAGWGLPNITNSLPMTNTTVNTSSNSALFFVDQSPLNALATGDAHTYFVNLNQDSDAQYNDLHFTLVWTDPPGDPNAAVKLVNNLDLIVTNLDTGDVGYGSVYFGNNFAAGSAYSAPWDTNNPPALDTINNVKQIVLPNFLAGNYSVTVLGRSVNVNAVTAQTNNTVQDYALVISDTGDELVPDAFAVVDGGMTSQPTSYQDITDVITTNAPLFDQFAGANSPLLGTNTISLGSNTTWSASGVLTVGMTNQWHFYVVTNNALDAQGNSADVTNAAFIVFNSETLSLQRMGTLATDPANATTPEADIDLYVSTDPSLTNLSPAAIANCLAGTVAAPPTPSPSFGASLGQGGTEFVVFSNSAPGQVYFVGVKSESHMAAEYAFMPIFTSVPFSQLDKNGNQIVNGMLLPMNIPDGSNAKPGVTNVFGLAIYPMKIAKVIVTNLNEHENYGDLFGVLSYGPNSTVLNSHAGLGNTFGALPRVYDDSRNPIAGSTPSAGPGSLVNFRGKSTPGLWILSEEDDAQSHTGRVSTLTLKIQPHRDLNQPGVVVSVPAGGWFVDYVDVPPGYTNLTFYGTNIDNPPVSPAIQMYEKLGNEPTLADYDQRADLVNGSPPGNIISVGPPLNLGRYFIGLYNPGLTDANVLLAYSLGFGSGVSDAFSYASGSSTPLLDDAVSSSVITVPNTVTQLVAGVNVGIVVDSPRISDYTFTLISPTGQSVLLMENRGGTDTNGAGAVFVYTNVLNATASGGAAPDTNYLQVSPLGGTVPITYNFYTVKDEMTVYAGTNSANFYIGSPDFLWDTGFTNNPPIGNGAQSTAPATINVPYSGVSYITIIMNQFGNPYAGNGDAWTYTAGAPITNYEYMVFTDDTNLTDTPIKFAQPPFSFTESSSNFTLCDFELVTNGDYFAPTNIYDLYGGWTLPTNLVTVSTVFNTNYPAFSTNAFVQVTNVVTLSSNYVSVVADPSDSIGDNTGTNLLALATGTIMRDIATVPGRIYNVTFWYRGPGISSWWRGEGDATDSSDPEKNGNNGTLVGRFNFPAGEVGQAFGFLDAGQQFQFAGTNTYVQIRQNTALDVGKGGGFTVEGWINPTNVMRPQPIVEWLAKVPTNAAVTNLVILAGPYLNPATAHYYYLLAATNWTVSEFWAKQLGGHLATVNTANEQNWIFDNFANYGGVNRNLWIGLTNDSATTFGWSNGDATNYFNWLSGQPLNSNGTTRNYTFIRGTTNAPSGLWLCANNNGYTQNLPGTTNIIYGVVEVEQIQTNGVQLWVSATNSMPGGTNRIVSTNGCIYANLIDVSNAWHEVWSAPGLLATNVYQHIALTFDTNSGLAKLYLNGTNVATTNLFMVGNVFTPFVPRTDGDVLLGRDMTLYTNNFFSGRMDEMSIYSRALSDAEIAAIYRISTTATNGLTGKFDPSVVPAVGLAEALVTFGNNSSNVIFGVNNQWEVNSYTFTATTNTMPLRITGMEPGILLDNFAVSEAPLTNLYYLPEQSLNDTLAGGSASGDWQLLVWDDRVGAYVTNFNGLVSWQLNFILASNSLVAASLAPQTPTPSTVGPGQTVYYLVNVPAWAQWATNILVSSDTPVSLLFDPTNLPTGYPGDQTLLSGSTGGIGSPVLAVNQPFPLTAANQAGSYYYLGVSNSSTHAASVVLEVDYDIMALTNGVPFTNSLSTNDSVRYFSFAVTSNAYAATFQLLKLSSNADLVVRKGVPLPNLTNTDYGSFNATNADENIYVFTNSSPVPLSAGTWYLGVFRRDAGPVNYTVLAKELDTATPTVIPLTNGVPFNFTAGPGAALTNFFRFSVSNSATAGLRFELYNLTGNGDLTVQTNALPLSPPFFESSQNAGRTPELIWVFTNTALTNLAADWYLGVPNREITNINYTIVAMIDTNGYFPAFPGAEGTGGGAFGGGRLGYSNTVYHVVNLNDAGDGSLRDAVSSTNRTVVFDVSGTIYLQSQLVITNSYLTLAGQTAPGDGITVAGWETSVTNAHDVIIRYLRFRPGNAYTNTTTVWFSGFEGATNDSTPASGSYFAGGWSVDAGSVDWLTNGTFSATAYSGNCFIDLNGNGPAVISTNVPTVVGMQYAVNFAYTRNPDAASEQAAVLADGQVLGTLTAANANSWANLGWQTASYFFTATSNSTHLAFMSTNTPGLSGVLLDAVSLTTNVVVTAAPGDALRFITVSNVIADHVTATWAPRQVLSAIDSTNLTVQWSVMSQQLYDTNGIGDGSQLRQGNGALSFHHNLYADNYAGSPHLSDNVSLDFVNNVIYNWGTNAGSSLVDPTNNPAAFTNQINYTCNYLIAGSNSFQPWIAFRSMSTNTWIFQTNNFIDTNFDGVLNGGDTHWLMFTNPLTQLGRPLSLVPVTTDEAYQAYEKVLAFAGTSLLQRDTADTNLVTGVRQQNGQIIHSQNQVGGWPTLNSTAPLVDTDQDGIPDYWEITFTGIYPTPTNPIGSQASSALPGYTRLEEYLSWLANPHALTFSNTTVAVDLYKLTGNSGNLSFSATNAINGTVYLTNVLYYTNYSGMVIGPVTNTGTFSNSIAVFTPTNTSPGYASFDYYVTNNDTHAYFGPVTVSVVVSGVPVSPIITLTNLMPYTNQTTYSGLDYYRYDVSTNCYGVKFEILNPSGDVNLYASYGLPLPLVSNPVFDASTNGGTTNELILVLTNTAPVSFTNGWWYLTVSNASGVPVNYTILATELVAPVFIYSPANTNVFELTQLTVTNTAITYSPGHTITYTNFLTINTNAMNLLGWTNAFANTTNTAPVIDANGIITWTPSEAQGPGVYTLTTIAFDTNSPPTSSTNHFDVTVYEVNTPPFWPTNTPSQTNYTIPGLTLLTVTNTALDADLPTNLLAYQLFVTPSPTNLPAITNAVIDTNGIITWTPTLAQTPGFYTFMTVVTDTNAWALTNQVLSATNYFTVTVTPVALPFAFTHPAQSPTGTNAQLDGMVTPNGLPTTAWFQWGTSTNYGLVTPPSVVGSNFNFNVIYTASSVTGLTVNLPYHYRLVVSNAVGMNFGFDQIFDQGNLVAWGADFLGQTTPIPVALTNLVTGIGAGYDFSIALNNNGSVISWGDGIFGQTNVPADLTNAVSVSGGYKDGLALRRDRSVRVWGSNQFRQTNVPPNLTNAVLAVSGDWHCLALRDNGTVVPWGNNLVGQTNLPPGLSNVVFIASGGYHSLALKNDGTVVAWGDDSYGQTNVPAGLSNVVAVAGGESHSVALKNDGTIIAWGDNSLGQTNVPAGSNFIAIACGGFHSLGLRSDGTVQLWGDTSAGQLNGYPTNNLTNAFAIAGSGGGGFHSLALTSLFGLNQTNNAPFWTNNSPVVQVFEITNQPASVLFTNAATDTNVPAQILSYRLLNPPAWAVIGQYTGILTLTPTEPVGLGTNILTVVVTDNGYPALSATNTVTVVVYEINTPPFWPTNTPSQSNYVINAANLLTVADTAFDADVPTNALTYSVSVSGGVTNAFISTNGIFTWTPSPAQVSSNAYTVTVTVTDTNAYALTNQTLTATNTFTVTVLPPLTLTNGLASPPNILAGNSVNFYLVPVPATADFATNTLLFATPAGVNVWFTTNAPPSVGAINDTLLLANSTGGLAILNTTSSVPLLVTNSFYWLGVQNTNNFAVTNALEVDFHLVSAPVVAPVNISSIIFTNIATIPGYWLTWFAPSNDLFQVQWTPSLAPTNWQTFLLPPVVMFNPNFPASATNAQFNFFDDASQTGGSFGTNRFYRLRLVNPLTNTPPEFLFAPTNFVAIPNIALVVTNTAHDWDFPVQTLTYSVSGSLAGTNLVTIDPNGIITWTPTLAQSSLTNIITTIVTDSGVPAMSATNVFVVVVATVSIPYASALPAKSVTGTTALLNGFASPNGTNSSTAWFEWGASRYYGGTTPPVTVGGGSNVVYVTASITGLISGQSYYYRLVVSNALTVVRSFEQQFAVGSPVAWGAMATDPSGLTNPIVIAAIPSGLTNTVAVAAGTFGSDGLALRADGTITAWGFGPTSVPVGLTNAVAVASGMFNALTLKSDGTVAAWGDGSDNMLNIPAGATNIVAIAAGYNHFLALKDNGTVVAWGNNSSNQTNVPAGLSNVVAIAGGAFYSQALKNDGTVVNWGGTYANVPAGLTNVVALGGGVDYSAALIGDGTVRCWGPGMPGSDFGGPLGLGLETNVPPNLTNAVIVSGGTEQSIALRTDGTVVCWGYNYDNQLNAPAGLSNVVAVASGQRFCLALTSALANTLVVPTISSITTSTNSAPPSATNGLALQWNAPVYEAFQMRWTTNLAAPVTWTLFPNIFTSTNGSFNFADTNAPFLSKFYQLILLP